MSEKEEINVIFAAAPSQSEFLFELMKTTDIDWSRVNAMHLDEYIGLKSRADQLLAKFLKENIFDKAIFKKIHTMNFMNNEVEDELIRYSKILKEHPLDIAFIGIEEIGHIAFNDPWVANFNDPLLIKEVKLDKKCRQQQVNDGCFKSLSEVPTTAATVTLPHIISAKRIFCIVPAASKAEAINRTIYDKINENCPATILRNHENTTLYLDKDSAKYIL